MRGLGISNPMFFIGVVENNNDKHFQGRIQVRAFGIHGTHDEVATKDLPWAICASGNYDPNSPIPPMNSFVYGMFLDGDQAQHPLILGMIPTQYVEKMNPSKDGYGVIPEEGNVYDPLFKGFRPIDIGDHQSSKLRRAEDLGDTYVAMDCVMPTAQKIAGTDETWQQPPTAYSAKYPYNRVIETAAHSIELDDTPGAERIMIHHKSGTFIQIDSKGTTTERAEGDRYEINIGTKHEASGGSVVTINGDAHVYVKGNKTEEIEGNYKLIVHGTTELGSADNIFVNAGDSLQLRGSVTRVEAATDALTLFGKEQIQLEAEKQVNMVSQNIKNNALLSYDVFSPKGFKFTTPLDFHVNASNIILTATGLIPPAPGLVQFVSGTVGTPIQAGLNVIAPGVNIAAANGSFAGIWNASVVNAGVVTGTTGNFTTSFHTDLNAFNGDFTNLNAPMPLSTAPGSPCAPNTTNPASVRGISLFPTIAIPTLPLLVPPAFSDPTPPIFGKASGWAYPTGNGPEFLSSVLTAPFSFISDLIEPLKQGGFGITRAQMPEPPQKSTPPAPRGYNPKGFDVGVYVAPPEDND